MSVKGENVGAGWCEVPLHIGGRGGTMRSAVMTLCPGEDLSRHGGGWASSAGQTVPQAASLGPVKSCP